MAREGRKASARRGRVPLLFLPNFEKRKFLKNTPCRSFERDIIETSKTTKPHLITEIKMDVVKSKEILKTIENRGPFFAFDEIDQNAKARDYFFELQVIDARIAKQSIAFHNAKNDGEKVNAWRWLLANFDSFKVALYNLKSEIEDGDASAFIDEIWGDCCDFSFEARKQQPNKTRCLALNSLSNISWLLIRCCTKDALNYYQDNLSKAWQDVLKDEE